MQTDIDTFITNQFLRAWKFALCAITSPVESRWCAQQGENGMMSFSVQWVYNCDESNEFDRMIEEYVENLAVRIVCVCSKSCFVRAEWARCCEWNVCGLSDDLINKGIVHSAHQNSKMNITHTRITTSTSTNSNWEKYFTKSNFRYCYTTEN